MKKQVVASLLLFVMLLSGCTGQVPDGTETTTPRTTTPTTSQTTSQPWPGLFMGRGVYWMVAPDNRPPTTADRITFFSNTTDDVTIVAWDWDFGDGRTGFGEQIDHKYDQEGTYTVKLMVTDAAGNTYTATESISVAAPGQAMTSEEALDA